MTDKAEFPVQGMVAPGFEPVRDRFNANFEHRGEIGAAIHVTLDGNPVVDLWGGAADAARTQPWAADTVVNVWSTTKGWLSLAMHILADRGLLDFDDPVAKYWPEFVQYQKGSVLVRHFLTHTAGLPAPSMKVPHEAIYDWAYMVHSLEQSHLFWEPGTKYLYHAATFGWLNGEVLRRITGSKVGEFLQTEIAGPLSADAFIGLPESMDNRAADTIPPDRFGKWLFKVMTALGGRAKSLSFSNPPRPYAAVNTRRWRAAEIPSSNGHASARGLANLYTPLALGGEWGRIHFLSPNQLEIAAAEQVPAKEVGLGPSIRQGLGFMLVDPAQLKGRPTLALGHAGMGGSLGFADPHNRLALGYVMNKMVIGFDTRSLELCRALYRCLE